MSRRPPLILLALLSACTVPTAAPEPAPTRPAPVQAAPEAAPEAAPAHPPSAAPPPRAVLEPASGGTAPAPRIFAATILPNPDLPWESGPLWGDSARHPQGLTATSTLPPQGSNTYGLQNLSDDDPRTAWVEGAEGHGVGQRLSFVWQQDQSMDCRFLYVMNGYQRSAGAYKANGRVKDLNIYLDGALVGTATLEDRYDPQSLQLDAAPGQRVELEIASVYPGEKYQDTAISELVQMCLP